MQECEKKTNLKFVVFDLYIPWLVSSASINDGLNKKVHLLDEMLIRVNLKGPFTQITNKNSFSLN